MTSSDTTAARPASSAPAAVNRVTLAAMAGTVIEFYDFALYAIAAALVLGPVYFPTIDPAAATLASLATFATGFLARPLGSLLFGHIGDRVGRRAVLLGTVLTTGGATFAMGLLPGYEQLGVAAPVLLIVLRLTQGLGVGGEWTGAVVLATEHAPPARRGLWASLPQTGPAVGFLMATGALLGCSATLNQQQFQSWGWRIPFLAHAACSPSWDTTCARRLPSPPSSGPWLPPTPSCALPSGTSCDTTADECCLSFARSPARTPSTTRPRPGPRRTPPAPWASPRPGPCWPSRRR